MEANRLFTNRGLSKTSRQPVFSPVPEAKKDHEAVEVSLCDEGMCFTSEVRHSVGAVLLVDFAPAASDNDDSLRSEAIVVECEPSDGGGFEITVIFTGN